MKRLTLHSLRIAPRQLTQYRCLHVSAPAWEKVKVPQMAESISEGTLKQWLKQKGDHVEADEEVATIETDKIDVSVNAPFAGTITDHFAAEEDTVTVGQDLFDIEQGDAPAGKAADKPEASSKDSEASTADKDASSKKESTQEAKSEEPEAQSKRRKPDEAKVDKREDAPAREQPQHSAEPKQPAASKPSAPKPKEKEASAPTAKPAPGNRTERRVKMTSMRKRISERLKQSQDSTASLTTFNEVDMSALMALRKTYKDRILKEKGIKFGFMSAFAKASAFALQEFPDVNAAIEGAQPGEQMVYHDFVDISVAVATPKGLVTPVIRNVEAMSMLDIEQAISEAGKKARDGKITLEDMAGGTFTISNGGVFGSLMSQPIINLPQSAVLGMHAIKDRAVVVNGQIVIRPIMMVALTYNHQAFDGSTAVRFLVRVKELLEDPAFMLLQ